jgi:phosphoribosylanthranilate isomerase
MIFAPSPQRIEWGAAEEIARHSNGAITPVAVFVDPTTEEIRRVRKLFPDCIVQLSGNETPAFTKSVAGIVVKALHVGNQSEKLMERTCERYAPAIVLFDTKVAGKFGGSGRQFDWTNIARLARWRPVLVAGGLTAQNVGACVKTVRPFGVDVRSGIETSGRKDPDKMRRFVRAVRESDASR